MSMPPLPMPKLQRADNMSASELNAFMKKHGFSDDSLADLLGVTLQAVRLWVRSQREISVTVTRLLRMLDKYPQMIQVYRHA